MSVFGFTRGLRGCGVLALVLSIMGTATAQADDVSDCPQMLQSHGFLSRARGKCDFPEYSDIIANAAGSCAAKLPAAAVREAIQSGVDAFDNGERSRGSKALCDMVAKEFSGVFGDVRFLDLRRTLRTVRSLVADGKASESLPLALKLKVDADRQAGRQHVVYLDAIEILGIAQASLGKYNDAIENLLGALDLSERLFSGNSVRVARALNNLAETYQRSGAAKNALPILERALSLHQRISGPVDIAGTSLNLANVLAKLEMYDRAEAYFRKALDIATAQPSNNGQIAAIYRNLGEMHRHRSNYAEARACFEKALSLGGDSVDLVTEIGLVSLKEGKFAEAFGHFERALKETEAVHGIEHHTSMELLNNLGAAQFFAMARAASGPQEELARQARTYLDLRRRATAAVLLSGRMNVLPDAPAEDLSAERDVFERHLAALMFAALLGPEEKDKADREAFQVAQLTNQSATAIALRQMAVRFSRNDDRLQTALKERQRLAAVRIALRQQVADAVSADRHAQLTDLRGLQRETEDRFAALSEDIHRRFPEFSGIVDPKPLGVERVQRLLVKDEALLLVVPNSAFIHVYAMTDNFFQSYVVANWNGPDQPEPVLPGKDEDAPISISRFRNGLGAHDRGSFDIDYSFDVYRRLFGDLKVEVTAKSHWNVVGLGKFTSMPFHLLVTEKPEPGARGLSEQYRRAAWIIRRNAISVLPAVDSLEALRVVAARPKATKSFIGFGNPLFAAGNAAEKVRVAATRSYSEFWKGQEVDRARLSAALPSLPETEKELRDVSRQLGGCDSDLYLRERATERMLKSLKLKDFDIVYFATHGLVAGDVKGLGQPSLALTLPKKPDAVDDGLLTASEIGDLSIDASWVVLSACNTVAGDRPGAEALSGLAKAFFHAGARTLLVSHWEVQSEAAARLATSTFQKLSATPRAASRADALRQSMLDYINDTSDAQNSNPLVWGAFEIVGDGHLK
jgi:CHAT domain-containing protein/Tfp pilus assembly protein PilF